MILLIDILDNYHERLVNDFDDVTHSVSIGVKGILYSVKEGVPLSTSDRVVTNGDVIKALFPNLEITYNKEEDIDVELYNKDSITADVSYGWWNAPYERSGD